MNVPWAMGKAIELQFYLAKNRVVGGKWIARLK